MKGADDDRHQAKQARAALADPKNRTRVPWVEPVKPAKRVAKR